MQNRLLWSRARFFVRWIALLCMPLFTACGIDAQQFVLVMPDGTENNRGVRSWNATPAC